MEPGLTRSEVLEAFRHSRTTDLVAEVFYQELRYLLGEGLQEQLLVVCHGMNRRVKSKDLLGVTAHCFPTAASSREFVVLDLARNSIYHQLPELLFHPLVISKSGMSNQEIVAAIRANARQDKELIRFFAPFDTAFFLERARLYERHLHLFSNPESRRTLLRIVDAMEQTELDLSAHQKYLLLLFLCRAEEYKERLPALEQLLQVVLGLHVQLRYEPHESDEAVYRPAGEGRLGIDLGLNGPVRCETDDVSATVVFDRPVESGREVAGALENVRGILGFFVWSERTVRTDYAVRGEVDFLLGANRLGYNTNL